MIRDQLIKTELYFDNHYRRHDRLNDLRKSRLLTEDDDTHTEHAFGGIFGLWSTVCKIIDLVDHKFYLFICKLGINRQG
jgi:hypothetical protein